VIGSGEVVGTLPWFLPKKLVTHRFAMNDIMKAYDTFGNAAKEGALKVVLKNDGTKLSDAAS
jgi:hypothetical protein